METRTAYLTIWQNTGGMIPDGRQELISCGSTFRGRETLSLKNQAIDDCANINEPGSKVATEFPNSVKTVKLEEPGGHYVWVDAAEYDAQFDTLCTACCTE